MTYHSSHASASHLAQLARAFREHGANIYGSSSAHNASPLYAVLAPRVADDPELLALAAEADRATTVTNLFFGAVQYLLMADPTQPLAAYYASLTPQPLPPAAAYPLFRQYCLAHSQELQHLVRTRLVQTNEVGRCAGLLPAFALVAQRTGGRPLALVEIGASAGLHLLWDRYHYSYGQVGTAGDPSALVHLRCEPRGAVVPPLPAVLPTVASRVGIDLAPIDVRDAQATQWLRALIWPEQTERLRLLEAALQVAAAQPPPLVQGDAEDVLPAVLAAVPQESVLCVYDSYTLNQVPRSKREAVLARLKEHAAQRDLYRIAQEGFSLTEPPHIEVTTYSKDVVHDDLLAYCESHGRWIEWRYATGDRASGQS